MTEVFKKAADIAGHLSGLLAEIQVANGYNTDIGLAVYRGRRKIDDEMVPCSVLIEGDDKPGDNVGREEVKITQSYVLGGYVTCDPDQPNDAAHLVLKDIKKALFRKRTLPNGSLNFDGRVRKVEYKGRDIGPRADGKPIVFAVVFIDVEFAETLADA